MFHILYTVSGIPKATNHTKPSVCKELFTIACITIFSFTTIHDDEFVSNVKYPADTGVVK